MKNQLPHEGDPPIASGTRLCTYPDCPYPNWRDADLCVFHLPKLPESQLAETQDPQRRYHVDLRNAFAEAFSALLTTEDALLAGHERNYTGFHISGPLLDLEAYREPVLFDDAVFYDTFYFNNADFQEGARFEDAHFLSPVFFLGCDFDGPTSFSGATFSDNLEVRNTRFRNVDFSAVFCGSTSFTATSFAEGIFCRGALFHGDCRFSACRFGGYSSFRRSVVGRKLQFERAYPHQGETNTFGEGADFSSVVFEEAGQIAFMEMDLQGVSFVGTDLERASFSGVQWPRIRSALRTRRCLSDETQLYTDLDGRQQRVPDSQLAENYRQLVLTHEKKRDFVAAEDFHIGEMEAQRRLLGAGIKNPTLRHIREWVNSYMLYRLLTFYGTSYWWAFSALLVFVGLFASAFLLAGFQPAKESVGAFRGPIEYDLLPDSAHRWVASSQLFRDFGQAILFVLSILTFQRDRFYEPTTDWARLILFVAVLVLPAQAALVLLAIRRRFKR